MKAKTATSIDDKMLAEGVHSGSRQCEELLVRKFREGVKAALLRNLSDTARAEDLAHETLVIVLKKLRSEGISDPEHLTAYVYKTARYVHIGWLRRKDNQVELRDCMDDCTVAGNAMEDQLVAQEQHRQLRDSIHRLPVARDKDILQRHYLLDQSKDEICAEYALSVNHYDRVISRARNRLREYIDGAFLATA